MSTHVNDLLGAYALDALDPGEAEEVRKHLEDCSSCQAELDSYQGIVTALPLSLPEERPSPDLKSRIMTAARQDMQARGDAGSAVPEQTGNVIALSSRRRRAVSLAPALAVAAIVLLLAGVLVGRATESSTTTASAQQQYQVLIGKEASRGDRIVPLRSTGVHRRTEVSLAIGQSGRASIVIGPSIAPGKNRIYQLWFMTNPKHPVSAGVFSAGKTTSRVARITASSPKGYKLAAITEEPAPHGSPKPTTKPIALAQLGNA